MSELRSLEEIRIARPCPALWEEMAGDDRVRYCDLCGKNVYNLSALSRKAATELVAKTEGKLCALLYRRQDGTVLSADCPVGVRGFVARLVRRAFAAAAGLLFVLSGRELGPEREVHESGGRLRSRFAPQPRESRALDAEELARLRLLGSLGYVAEAPSAKPHGTP